MCAALRALGAEVNTNDIPDLEHCAIDDERAASQSPSPKDG